MVSKYVSFMLDTDAKYIGFIHQQQLVKGLLQSHSASIHPTMS
jgi:hypothetical protein